MANDAIVIETVFDPVFGTKQVKKIVKKAKEAGEKAGKEFGKEFSKGTEGALSGVSAKGLATAFGAVTAAVAGTAFVINKFAKAASRQEDSVQRLNNALKNAGDFSQEASSDFQDFAKSIQEVTRFGDELILEQAAFAKSFGASNKQVKQVVAASTDLATAFNIDLTSATRNVAKTLGGYAGELAEVIPELKAFTKEQLQAGAGVEFLAQRFKGLAAADVGTFAGQFAQFRNALGDSAEAIGEFITKSPLAATVLNGLKKAFEGVTAKAKDLSLALRQDTAAEAAKRIDQLRVANLDLEEANKKIAAGQSGFVRRISGTTAEFKNNTEAIKRNKEEIERLTSKRVEFAKKEAQIAAEQARKKAEIEKAKALSAAEEKKKIAEQNLQQIGLSELQIINENEATKREVVKAALDAGVLDKKEAEDRETEVTRQAIEARKKLLKKQAKEVVTAAEALGDGIKRGIGQGIGAGFGAFGKALAEGENALDAFAKAFLGTLGQMMIQQGTAFILQGLGFSVIPGLQGNGSTLIATGAALATLGGVLSAVGGGGGAAPAAGGGVGAGGGGGGTVEEGSPTGQVEEREEPATQVAVNIQGDVLDSTETGLRIVDVLNSAFDQQGVTINREIIA